MSKSGSGRRSALKNVRKRSVSPMDALNLVKSKTSEKQNEEVDVSPIRKYERNIERRRYLQSESELIQPEPSPKRYFET